MERKFHKVRYEPKRIKLLFNHAVPNSPGDIVSMKDKSSLKRINESTLVESSTFWIAGPVFEKVNRDRLSEKIQMSLIEDKSDFYICGSIDLTVHYEAEKEVLDEVIDYLVQHNQNIGYFEELGNRYVVNLMQKLGFYSSQELAQK